MAAEAIVQRVESLAAAEALQFDARSSGPGAAIGSGVGVPEGRLSGVQLHVLENGVRPVGLVDGSRERVDGKFVIRSNRFSGFRVGNGGPEIKFDGFNGDVKVVRRTR